MGEIVVSIAIGGCLVLSGVILLVTLRREEKAWKQEAEQKEGNQL